MRAIVLFNYYVDGDSTKGPMDINLLRVSGINFRHNLLSFTFSPYLFPHFKKMKELIMGGYYILSGSKENLIKIKNNNHSIFFEFISVEKANEIITYDKEHVSNVSKRSILNGLAEKQLTAHIEELLS